MSGAVRRGLAVGVAASLTRAMGVRAPAPLAAVVTGATAMAVSDVPASRSGPDRPSVGLLLRSLLLGVATGGRSSLGFAGPVLRTSHAPGRSALPRRAATAAGAVALGAEMVADKLPSTPSRLVPPALALRVATGSGGAAALARREQMTAWLPAVAGALGAAAGSQAGAQWRRTAAGWMPDWQAALVEDGAALLLATVACRTPRTDDRSHRRPVGARR